MEVAIVGGPRMRRWSARLGLITMISTAWAATGLSQAATAQDPRANTGATATFSPAQVAPGGTTRLTLTSFFQDDPSFGAIIEQVTEAVVIVPESVVWVSGGSCVDAGVTNGNRTLNCKVSRTGVETVGAQNRWSFRGEVVLRVNDAVKPGALRILGGVSAGIEGPGGPINTLLTVVGDDKPLGGPETGDGSTEDDRNPAGMAAVVVLFIVVIGATIALVRRRRRARN